MKFQPYANSFTSVISTPEPPFTKRKRKGKRPTSTMYCNHCKQGFRARPTLRPISNHFVLNHTCGNGKRTQYVLGRKHRRCQFGCDPLIGCIVFGSESEEREAFHHVKAKTRITTRGLL